MAPCDSSSLNSNGLNMATNGTPELSGHERHILEADKEWEMHKHKWEHVWKNRTGNPKVICVIGAAGFIGSHFCEKLMYESDRYLIAIDMVGEKIEHLLKPGQPHSDRIEFHKFDIRNGDPRLEEAIKKCDVCFNLAAICNPAEYNTRPIDTINSNFTDAVPVIQLCADYRKHLIHFSTCEVYGKTLAGFADRGSSFRTNPDNYMLREDQTMMILGPISKQRWSYACAKQLVERVIYAEGTQNSMPFTIVRPFNWIGPRMDYIPGVDGPSDGIPRVLACFSTCLMSNKPMQLVDGGKNQRTFVYVKDAVEVMYKIMDNPEKSVGRIFNVGNPDNEVTIKELADMMADVYSEVTNKPKPNSYSVDVPAEKFYGPGYDDCDKRIPDNTLIERQLDWKPATSLRDALKTTLDYMERSFGEQCRKTAPPKISNIIPSAKQVEEMEKLSISQ